MLREKYVANTVKGKKYRCRRVQSTLSHPNPNRWNQGDSEHANYVDDGRQEKEGEPQPHEQVQALVEGVDGQNAKCGMGFDNSTSAEYFYLACCKPAVLIKSTTATLNKPPCFNTYLGKSTISGSILSSGLCSIHMTTSKPYVENAPWRNTFMK